MWARVVEVLGAAGANLPKNLDEVDHFEVGSPVTFKHYYESEKGAFYGLDHDVHRFEAKNFYLRLRSEIPEVPGLFMTGQDITGDGLVNAMGGGLICAQKVLGVTNPFSLLRREADEKESEDVEHIGGLLDGYII